MILLAGLGAAGGLELAVSVPLILGGALLFTNAVEWLGWRLGIGAGAVGSLLAAVGTALPESIIPILALARGGENNKAIAIGAIIGAPFVLATVAMAAIGASAFAFRKRRGGIEIKSHAPTTRRDLGFFIVCILVVLLLGAGLPFVVRAAGAGLLLAAYVVYAVKTVRGGGELIPEGDLEPLTFDRSKSDAPPTALIAVQLVIGLAAIIAGAELFVGSLLTVSQSLGLPALAVALVLTPVITELPEKFNSVLWVRDGEDALALGNVTGAMVFQSAVPVSLGLLLSDWELNRYAYVAGGLAVTGGVLAILALRAGRFSAKHIAGWTGLFVAFVVYVIVTG